MVHNQMVIFIHFHICHIFLPLAVCGIKIEWDIPCATARCTCCPFCFIYATNHIPSFSIHKPVFNNIWPLFLKVGVSDSVLKCLVFACINDGLSSACLPVSICTNNACGNPINDVDLLHFIILAGGFAKAIIFPFAPDGRA